LKKIIFGIIIATLFSNLAFAQEVNFGNPAIQEVKITISEDGSAHVTHFVESKNFPQQLNVISDDFTNLQIIDEENQEIEYAETGGEISGFLIFPTKNDVIVDYDVPNAISEKDGMWTWNYLYLASTAFYLPQHIDLIYANDVPVNVAGKDGIKCHGCQLKLEYELENTETVNQVQWEDKKFDVRIITQAEISSFEFDQPGKKITFDVNDKEKHIVLVVPLELLWNPYEVFLNEQKILKHEFYSDGQNIWLGMTPNETGTIEIIGISAVPEFPLATVLVLAVSMVVVAKFTKFNLR
jgi:hypothetical protein